MTYEQAAAGSRENLLKTHVSNLIVRSMKMLQGPAKRVRGWCTTSLLDDNRAVEPPESIPNSEVKRSIADGSVGLPHVRVGHRQALIQNPWSLTWSGVFSFRACRTRQGRSRPRSIQSPWSLMWSGVFHLVTSVCVVLRYLWDTCLKQIIGL